MRWFLTLAVACWLAVGNPGFKVLGHENDIGMISPVMANRAGMTVAWFTQLETASFRDLASIELVINENNSTTFFEVKGGPLREVISQHDISPFGKPFGIDDAEKYADIRREIMQARLQARNRSETVTVNKYTLPQTTVFAMNHMSTVHAIDGETGKTLWKTKVGSTVLPAVGLGANKTHVAVANGSTVYCLEAATGKVLWERKASHAIGDSPAVSDEAVFVPLINGRLEVMPIEMKGINTGTFTSIGRALSTPTVLGDQVAWTTDNGLLSVAPSDTTESILFRLRGDSAFESSATARSGMLYLASINGYVYGLEQKKGRKIWSISLGERISQAPVALGDSLYLFTDSKRVFQLNAQLGTLNLEWGQSLGDVVGYIGASQKNLYVINGVGDVMIVDIASGQAVGSLGYRGGLKALPNTQTDRVFVCTEGGMLQCLREIPNVVPFFHANEFTVAAQPATKPAGDPKADEAGEGEDVFDVFDRNKKPADNKNQGGGGDDPFRRGGTGGGNTGGGSGGSTTEDPFRRGGG